MMTKSKNSELMKSFVEVGRMYQEKKKSAIEIFTYSLAAINDQSPLIDPKHYGV